MKTVAVIETAAAAAVAEAGATRWVTFSVEETTEVRHRQETRGRPGANTRYRRIETMRHRLRFDIRDDAVAIDACSDGCWPLITSERELTCAQVLLAYKYQPNLERRNHMLKGPQEVAPMFLRDPARIEGLMTCHFVAMVVHALVEREIRRAMAARKLTEISLYPEGRGCSAPSAPRIFAIFNGVARQHLVDADGQLVQTFLPELTTLQQTVLDLLSVPASSYR
jgi:transposase